MRQSGSLIGQSHSIDCNGRRDFAVGGALKTMSKNFSSLILMKLCDHVGIWFIRVCFKFGLKIPSGSA